MDVPSNGPVAQYTAGPTEWEQSAGPDDIQVGEMYREWSIWDCGSLSDYYYYHTPRVLHEALALRSIAGDTRTASDRGLERYFRLMAEARVRLRDHFSGAELCMLCQAVKRSNCATAVDVHMRFFVAHVQDGLYMNGLGITWGVDGKKLIDKITSLDALSLFALADAIELFWAQISKDRHADPELILD